MRLSLPGADGHLQYCLRMVFSTGDQQQQGFSQVHDWFQNWISSSSSEIFELVVVAHLRVWSWTEESTVYDLFRHESADQSSNRRIFHMPRSEQELLFLSGHIVVQLGIRICHSIMNVLIYSEKLHMLHSNSTTSDVSDWSGPSSGWARTICTIQDKTTLLTSCLIK